MVRLKKIQGVKIMANRFVLNETSYHGKGAIKEIATEIKGRGFKKAFVCSDPDLIKFGVTKKVTDILDENKIDYVIYSEIKPNPTIENVQHGVESFKKSGADCLVAIGGGYLQGDRYYRGKPRIRRRSFSRGRCSH